MSAIQLLELKFMSKRLVCLDRPAGLKNNDAEPFVNVVIASAIPPALASDETLKNWNPV